MTIENIIKGRAIYMYNISMLIGADDNFEITPKELIKLLESFLVNNILEYPESFRLIYNFYYDSNVEKILIKEPVDSERRVHDYCMTLIEGINTKRISEVYDSVGGEKTMKIVKLAEMFMKYAKSVKEIDKNNKKKLNKYLQ